MIISEVMMMKLTCTIMHIFYVMYMQAVVSNSNDFTNSEMTIIMYIIYHSKILW